MTVVPMRLYQHYSCLQSKTRFFFISEYVGYGDKYKVYIKEGENRKLECDGYNSKSQTVRWLVVSCTCNYFVFWSFFSSIK